ncbi:glycine-rich protein-like [Photinus pyralis]|uniref:glycine-rich protein-like n=1 Tax=Photinus pyralis TaxID=7054 RepID=UPI0012670F30|nr:glycine-rich protein-like [Photinus pyralis]
MNALIIASFACIVACATASGYYGYGGPHSYAHAVPAGPTTLVGASGIVGPHGAVGPTGAVNGHGAVGPNGIPNAVHGGYVGGHGLYGGLGLGYAHAGIGHLGYAHAGIGHLGYAHAHDDGQWHGEGLWESQDHAGHAYGHGHGW